ncbi:MAG: hypothetical protein Q4E28_04940 [Clostridia bacterium]|nr:hypothetical protein [Clostridia bacterium]
MEKQKYLKIIDNLVMQGLKRAKIDRYIKALQKNYLTDKEIYENLSDFIMSEYEIDSGMIKYAQDNLDNAIIFAERTHIIPTADKAKNYKKDNPIYTSYIKSA